MADAGLTIGRDVRRVERAEPGRRAAAAGECGPTAFGVTGATVAERNERPAARDRIFDRVRCRRPLAALPVRQQMAAHEHANHQHDHQREEADRHRRERARAGTAHRFISALIGTLPQLIGGFTIAVSAGIGASGKGCEASHAAAA